MSKFEEAYNAIIAEQALVEEGLGSFVMRHKGGLALLAAITVAGMAAKFNKENPDAVGEKVEVKSGDNGAAAAIDDKDRPTFLNGARYTAEDYNKAISEWDKLGNDCADNAAGEIDPYSYANIQLIADAMAHVILLQKERDGQIKLEDDGQPISMLETDMASCSRHQFMTHIPDALKQLYSQNPGLEDELKRLARTLIDKRMQWHKEHEGLKLYSQQKGAEGDR